MIGDFIPRGQCGDWGSWAAAYQLANFAIFLDYVGIAELGRRIGLWIAKTKGTGYALEMLDVSRFWMLLWAFTLTCGVGHLEGVLSFYWPAYPLFCVWHWFTALLGAAGFLHLYRLTKAMGLRL